MGQCLTPFYKQDENSKEYMALPCGKCPDCYQRRASGWAFRLRKEANEAEAAAWVTMTYNNDSVPLVPIENSYLMNLSKKDVQLFMRRIRKAHVKDKMKLGKLKPIKYYVAGEYGPETYRPHYHAIILNAHWQYIEQSWIREEKVRVMGKRGKYLKKKALKRYSMGDIQIDLDLNISNISYTLKYMCKEIRVPLWKDDPRQPEFSLMSKGIGAGYLTQKMIDYHRKDLLNRMYLTLEDGVRLAMPRYFKEKIYTQFERQFIGRQVALQNPPVEYDTAEKLNKLNNELRYKKRQQQRKQTNI